MTVFRIVGALILSAFLAAPAMAALSDEVTCGGTRAPFCFVNETGLPLRLLVKPQSNLYADHDDYVAQVTASAEQAVAEGHLLQRHADAMIAQAESSDIGE